jgi:hypothetical protein
MGGYSRNYVRVMMPAGTALANREVRVRVHAVRGTLAEGLVEET